jgi:hypothetical protein
MISSQSADNDNSSIASFSSLFSPTKQELFEFEALLEIKEKDSNISEMNSDSLNTVTQRPVTAYAVCPLEKNCFKAS